MDIKSSSLNKDKLYESLFSIDVTFEMLLQIWNVFGLVTALVAMQVLFQEIFAILGLDLSLIFQHVQDLITAYKVARVERVPMLLGLQAWRVKVLTDHVHVHLSQAWNSMETELELGPRMDVQDLAFCQADHVFKQVNVSQVVQCGHFLLGQYQEVMLGLWVLVLDDDNRVIFVDQQILVLHRSIQSLAPVVFVHTHFRSGTCHQDDDMLI